MPRLFTGIKIPEDVGLKLEFMRGGIWGARWIDRENFHITLRFMGDISDPIAREISHDLSNIAMEPLELSLAGFGLFGGNEPHTLYATVEENPALRRLQAQHERLCQQAGLHAENRRFNPHVTLARLRDVSLLDLQNWITGHNLFRSRPFLAESFELFSSRPSRGGGPYAIEASYPFNQLNMAHLNN